MVKRKYPNVVSGGIAIPLKNKTNYYYMQGRKHEEGGIDIGKNPRTGLEVEDGEVMHVSNNDVKVFSSVPFLNGKSPAEKVIGGENPTKVFNAQERFKDIKGINDDGTRKKRIGGQIPRKNNYVTYLNDNDEKEFRTWYSKVAKHKNLNPDPDANGQDYDYRGYWKNEDRDGILNSNSDAHFTDKYKQPTHPTFSNESKYSNRKTPGGEWVRAKGTWLFKHNDFTARQADRTKEYLTDTGEGYILGNDTIIPRRKKRIGGENDINNNNEVVLNTTPNTISSTITTPDVSRGYKVRLDPSSTVTRQNYLDADREFSDSIRSIGNRYGIDPDMLATRIGREGPIDDLIRRNNKNPKVDPKSDMIEADGVYWGLDDIGTHVKKGLVKLEPHIKYTDRRFVNEKDRTTNSLKLRTHNNKGWAAGIHGVAGELKYRMEEMRKAYPNMTEEELKSATLAAYHRGIAGAKNYINNGNDYRKKYAVSLHVNKNNTDEKRYGGIKYKAGGVYSITNNGETKLRMIPSTGERTKAVLGTEDDVENKKRDVLESVFGDINTTQAEAKAKEAEKKKASSKNTNNDRDKEVERSYNNTLNDIISDGIGLVSNSVGSGLAYRTNKKMLNKLQYNSQPVAKTATKLKTRININPQLDKMRETLSGYERDVDNNTASSRVAVSRKQNARLANMLQTNELYGNKENTETELINKDRLNQQAVANSNIDAYNKWVEGKAAFRNAVLEKKSENEVSLINNLNAGIQDTITRRDKRHNENQTIAAMALANPNLPIEMFYQQGLVNKRVYNAFLKAYRNKDKNKNE